MQLWFLISRKPNELIAARLGSPLAIGVGGENEFFVASDATPFLEYTKNVIYLEERAFSNYSLSERFPFEKLKRSNN